MDADVSLSLTDSERKIINEFAHLLEKSKQLFNGLRDLPQYGHKQWQAYFGRTFDVYTKLWKFQQANRQVLDVKYGLKRWQIGEIASKIGQLYYHYYLRTSEANYLNESFSFYSAIRMRAYYSKASKEDRTDLMVKKLRYYARFIVVCLLLKKMKLVRDLVRELAKQIDDYTSTYEPDDHQEWTLVLGEIRAFIEADSPVEVIDLDGPPLVISHRLTPHTTPPLSQGIPIYLSLQEIIIVGNCYEQIKFSELTIDMFRMLQTLEKEPQEDLTSNALYDQSPAPGRSPFPGGGLSQFMQKMSASFFEIFHRGPDQIEKGPKNRENPHKYLLYKPTFTQLNTFLASGMKELPANSAMLLYLSADGSSASHKQSEDIAYDQGGVCTNNRRDDGGHIKTPNKRSPLIKDSNCLHPGDLYAYQRKPLFLVVDSDNSMAFRNFPNLFGQPLVCLLSPEFLPTPIQDQHHRGNLFTLFLYSPLEGVCVTSNIADLSAGNWEACQRTVHKFMGEASRLFTRARDLDLVYMQFFGDDFLRLLLLRFVFCYCVLRAHRGFKGQSYYPVSFPPMPVDEVLHHPVLHKIILELVTQLDVRGLFLEVMEVNE